MCGIVGYVGPEACAPILLDGLRRLEYRGYDSAGLAVHDGGTSIAVRRAVGKLRNLEGALRERPLEGKVGIGHTRWATHGRPSEVNAHPHVAGSIAVVHNGIIENHLEVRKALVAKGCEILSDTDTELVAHLVHLEVAQGKDIETAVRAVLNTIEGAYAIAVLDANEPERIVVAKSSSPLVLGLAEGETYCASDVPALLPYTRRMIFMEDGEMAVLQKDSVRITTLAGEPVERDEVTIDWSPVMAEKAGYKHFMLKEIFEQPRALEDTLRGRLDRQNGTIRGAEIGLSPEDAKSIDRVVLLACGTSHHAAMTGRYFIETLARVPTVVELASEFRGRGAVIGERDLVIGVSQSGETLDTLMAAKEAKQGGAKILAIANVIGSAIPRMADAVFYTHAGPEIGVASTKCFTTQVANLLMFAAWLGHERGVIEDGPMRTLVEDLARLPQLVGDTLKGTRQLVANLARRYVDARDVLFLGRGLSFPIALEGALKLKEISYVHAEGYAAGEMKHGPIALIDNTVPVLVLAPKDANYERSIGNLEEAKAREAMVIAVATEGDEKAREVSHDLIEIPEVPEMLTPFLTVLPLQLYAYYVADFKGTDVDQPRNLAKTVTVE
ncbi:MAG: glutamine--fructose-6-phosphate transaminase (isomerizing) [Sandaracinus sp.]|nr:glutamine--fructose-6-phosphate transaminase (isomerizing) [Sandaracinus sp.]|tara:strand:+ start:3066 stop:4901 length:1836 start_codon:yes stop_codon:yes gene_type:complete